MYVQRARASLIHTRSNLGMGGDPPHGPGVDKYCSHSAGTPFLDFIIFTAAVVKGMARTS